MSEKKRKRRSFWEPDSKKIVSWLDSQTDLGTSLQLIIVDAIRKYGEGDVIKSHLNQRETLYNETELQTTPTKPVRKEVLKDAGDYDKNTPKELEQEVEFESEPEDVQLIVQHESNSDDEMSSDNVNTTAETTGEDKEDEPEYDPIAVMFQDTGSMFNK
ncbi:hypothetical protein JUJ52_22655 [Virgibacillus sp. AGTR]|uniref:hypothetical protein n=1 Tax=Virgibacillus sp. AGTR TaxID=2812055 RepID=UPI001D1665CF|nr:hypothetical protein [Virgibacillus sp. AGTR]MCC2252726.1 hypothetical protein [Virgibacillus sp. AGTR]